MGKVKAEQGVFRNEGGIAPSLDFSEAMALLYLKQNSTKTHSTLPATEGNLLSIQTAPTKALLLFALPSSTRL